MIYTDAKWLSFIVEQLLSNAIKYTKQGVIRIYSENKMLIVEDTGIGIRKEDLPLVFERGYTGHTGRLDKRASGIGLYLANKIAGALQMRMELGPREGGGTRARIVFPSKPPEIIE
jgi:signal transduction histidine kinase